MTTVDDRSASVAELLHEAGETHHRVYRIVDGDDPDWASWCADWLLSLSELPRLLKATPVRSELTWLLVGLDKDYAQAAPDTPCHSGMRSGSLSASVPRASWIPVALDGFATNRQLGAWVERRDLFTAPLPREA